MKFKEGDRVKCADPGNWSQLSKDAIYTVDRCYSSGGDPWIVVKEARGGGWSPSRFELVEEAKPARGYNASFVEDAKPKWPSFKVGDLVRCINPGNNRIKAGDIGRVCKVELTTTPDGPMLHLEGRLSGFWAHRFELVEAAKPSDMLNDYYFGGLTRRGKAVQRVLEEEARRLKRRDLPRFGPDHEKAIVDMLRRGTFQGQIGSMDEYGPEPEKPNPLFDAIGKRWSNHPSDAVIHLDELRRKS